MSRTTINKIAKLIDKLESRFAVSLIDDVISEITAQLQVIDKKLDKFANKEMLTEKQGTELEYLFAELHELASVRYELYDLKEHVEGIKELSKTLRGIYNEG